MVHAPAVLLRLADRRHRFVRRRGLTISIAFAGAGVGAVLLLPWLQSIILSDGWRAACVAMGRLVLFVIAPITLLVRKSPADVGQHPDGGFETSGTAATPGGTTIVDPV
jgi:MFS family permease